ncbi:TMV resistance protein N-like [Eucalyptus grandis]|uniref:TMV resistance protein N-like n=1 Tax=Eucalyptus grandis TaxID=71139 RepID=UPI00192EBED0|nr:TMV resistance protein N-like [Eucalyptus grandis]
MDVRNNHSSLPSTRWPNVSRHQVFLSFRGGDVRRAFIEFLFNGLTDAGISVFIDHRGIEIGEEIMPKILQVIRRTQICIPVFSKDFASSKSCLTEVAEMVACDRTIMPIFYDVSPEVVGKQQENYQQSFSNHAAKRVTSTTLDNWKRALQTVSGKRGWELEKFQHGEHELINEVVSEVRQLLKEDDLDVTENLVGMDHHVREMMKNSAFSMKMTKWLNGKSFLKDIHGAVEQRRILSLQEDLISDLRKKRCTLRSPAEGTKFIRYKFANLRVLIILDDVSDFEQTDSLAGDPSWFGPGSRIIVISKRRNLVDEYSRAPIETADLSVLRHGSQRIVTSSRSSSVNICDDFLVEKFELKRMNDAHAFQMFRIYALKGGPLREEISSVAWDISLAAEGLPFLIKIVGSSLYRKPITFWKEALDRLKQETFSKEVKRILKARYEALEYSAQQIFLDIACFFMGKDKTISSYLWKACKYHPSSRIAELQDESLVTITDNNEFWMYNQVKFLGRELVKDENSSKPSERSRLWNQEDIGRVLNEDKVATVEALIASFDNPRLFGKRRFFHNFSNLRYLEMNCPILKGHRQTARNFREDLFLPWLKWLEWQRCLNISILLALDLSNLVYLNLSGSSSTNWRCWKQIIKV